MTTIKEKGFDMEIQTTIKDLPERIRQLGISPETSVRVIIDENETANKKQYKKPYPYIAFLDDNDFWDGDETPTDLSVNVDKYLYDE